MLKTTQFNAMPTKHLNSMLSSQWLPIHPGALTVVEGIRFMFGGHYPMDPYNQYHDWYGHPSHYYWRRRGPDYYPDPGGGFWQGAFFALLVIIILLMFFIYHLLNN
jgi:hypothetical protein